MVSVSDRQRIREGAKKVLFGNIKKGVSPWGQEYFYICPSLDRYHHQWLWDSCFHAITMRHFDIGLAKKEVLSLLSMVQPDGFLPHVIYWKGLNSVEKLLTKLVYDSTRFCRLTQPPIVGLALEKIFEKDEDLNFLEATLPAAERFYKWLARERDNDGDGLIAIIHPWEAGADENPTFDKAYNIRQPNIATIYLSLIKNSIDNRLDRWDLKKTIEKTHFNVESVGVNTLYAQSLRSLSRLFGVVNDHEKQGFFEETAIKVEKGLEYRCYHPKEGLFYDLAFKEKRRLLVTSYFSILPVILENLSSEAAKTIIEKHLLNPKEFWLPYPIPSVPKDNPEFDPKGMRLLWRGPTWININWFVHKALKKWGYNNEAEELLEKTVGMILSSGFREFYNPFTGEGLRSKNYGWSTLVVDMLEG